MASTLEQLLTCCICLDRFRNPKLLPCQHSVCMEPCMEGLVDYVRRQVKCPECRAEHRIPYNGVQGFPANVTLQRFLEAHIEITGETPDPFTGQIMERCGVCNEKNYLSTCAHCDKKICCDCKAAHADILKREIGRINNQVKRAVHRLGDQLSIVERNINALKQNSDSVTEDIDNISKRLQKAIRDRCESLKNEVLNYYNTEHRHLILLKEGLEQEINNVESNTDLAEKHMDDQTPWDDNELMDTKDIFLRTMEFIRGFDYESGDYNRRARFNAPDDINKLASTLASLGELIISNPRQTMDGFNSGSALQSGLMKSKSDHRLAAQFRDQELDPGHGYNSGRTSPVFRRRFGERPHVTEEPSPYDTQGDVGRRRFRSRFMRHEDDDRSVRFNDDEQPQPKPRPKVIDTEDVSRGPISGITRMVDSPRVIQRLQEKEGNFVKKKKEEPPKPVVQSAPKTPITFGTPRKTNRQLSEDEIDKIKKQNKSEASATSGANATVTSTPAKPSFDRLNSLKDSERSSRGDRPSATSRSGNVSPSSTHEEDTTSRRSSRDLGSSRYDYSSGNSTSASTNKSSADTGASARTYPYSRSSSTSSVGENGKPTGTKTSSRATDASTTAGRTSRSNSTDSNKSGEGSSKVTTSSSALANDDTKSRYQRTNSTDTKTTSTPSGRTTSGASRYQSRFLPRAGTPSIEASKESGNDDEEEEETSDDSETEDSEESSEEEEEEAEEKNTYQSSRGILTGRGTRNRDTTSTTSGASTNDSGYGSGNSTRHGAVSSSNDTSSSTYRRPSYYDSTKTSKDNDEAESKYPYASKYLNRRTSTNTTTTEEEKPNFQSRFLNKSKSSAILGPDTENDSHSSTATGSSRAKFEELKERRQRLARSKSSAGVEEDETPSPTESTPPTRRYGRDSDMSSLSSTSTTRASGATSTPSATATEDTPSNQLSSWARYLKNKYGNKTGLAAQSTASSTTTTTPSSSGASSHLSSKSSTMSTPTSRSIARSRSSHLLGLAKDDSLEDESKNAAATPTSHTAGTLGPTTFGNIHRTQYLQKQRLLFKIGSRGSEPGKFTWPRGIAIGPDDSIAVADSSNHRVQVFDKDGKYLKDFGSYGNGEGEFDCLAGVAVNRIGQFIIADRYNHRIQIFDPSGMFLRSFGSQGSSDGKFSYPWGVTTDSLGFIYVCDKENHRIQVFQSDGTFVGKFGNLGSKLGQLEHPHYIAVSSTNRVIVSDSNNHRIQVYDINGKVMTAFGSEGSDDGQFKFPRGVAVDEQGYIFVADSGNNRIQIFHPDGTFLRAFGCWGNGDGEFKGLEGVGVMSNGNILICDRENHRVQVF